MINLPQRKAYVKKFEEISPYMEAIVCTGTDWSTAFIAD